MSAVYSITSALCRGIYASYFHWTVYHRERVPLTGPVILAANHASYLDPPLVGCPLPREINYLARDTLFTLPVLGSYLRALNAVPVDREGGGGTGLKAILDRLQAGNAILLFPEGTRTSNGRLLSAKSGIGLTVIKSQAPVVPVRIFGTYEAYGRRHKWPRPHPVGVKYGHPILFESLRAEAKICSKPRLKQIYQEVADLLMQEIARIEPCFDHTTFP